MKIIIAPDSFKESLSAKSVANAIEKGLKKVLNGANFVKVPMADGGEGTTEALVDATNGTIYHPEVLNPLGKKIKGKLGILGSGDTAVIEMASASGLELISVEERNPLITTTYGTGQLIKAALDMGVKNIIIGIGGSATIDGGAGMIHALGGKLLDSTGKEIGFGGGALKELSKIDLTNLDNRLKDVNIEVACDVDIPLTGENGAARIFGPQKGATLDMILTLDNNLKHYADIIRKQLNKDIEHLPGSGAAGGLGAGLVAFLNAKLSRGIDIVIKYTNLEKLIVDADLVFTGEGSIDSQTKYGKVPYGVSITAKKYNVPVIVIAGNVSGDVETLYEYGFNAFFSITQGVCSLEGALRDAASNIERTSENIGRIIRLFRK